MPDPLLRLSKEWNIYSDSTRTWRLERKRAVFVGEIFSDCDFASCYDQTEELELRDMHGKQEEYVRTAGFVFF